MVLEVSMGTVLPVLSDVDESYDEMRNRAVDELQTDVEIDDITVQSNSSFHDIAINLTNKGSTVIDSSYVHCLVDGSIQGFTVNSQYFFPESSYSLSVNGLSGSGVHQVKVVTMNGISDYATYSYP